MSTTRKVLLVTAATFGLCVLGWIVLVGAVYAWGGVMSVRVESPDGFDLSLPVPVAAVDAALAAGELAFDQVHLNAGDYTAMLGEILEVIEDCPDAVFVEVLDRGDEVRISKLDGKLRVEVRERGEDGVAVGVSIPVKSVARLVS